MRVTTLFSIRRLLLTMACSCALLASSMVRAEDAGSRYSTDLPKFAHLAPLEDHAIDLQINGGQDAAGRKLTISAWQAVEDAALKTLLPDGSPHPLAHISKIKIASQLYANGEIDAAIVMAEEGISDARPYLSSYPVDLAEGGALLGVLLTQKGDPGRALTIVEPTYEQFLRLDDGARAKGFAIAKSNLEHSLSQINLRLGRTQPAITYQKASLDTREAGLGPNDADTVAAYYNYAQTLRRAGRMEEAEAIARTAVERAIAHVDPSHPSYARAFEMLGIVLANTGRPIEATEFLAKALALKREYEGADTLIFGYGVHNLGSIMLQRHKFAEAQPLLTEAEAIMSRYQGKASSFPILALAYNGQAALALGHPEEAVRLLSDARIRLGEDTRDVEALSRIMPDLVRALLIRGEHDGAIEQALFYEQQVAGSDTADALEIAFATLLRIQAQSTGEDDASLAAALAVLDTIGRSFVHGQSAALEVRHLAAIDLVMEIAAQHEDADLMLSAMSLVSESHTRRARSRSPEQAGDVDAGFAAALANRDTATGRLEKVDRALLRAMARGEVAEHLRVERENARAALRIIDASLHRRFPEWTGAGERSEPSISELRSTLGPDEAIMAVSPVYYGAHTLVITPSAARIFKIDATQKQMIDLANALGSSVRVGSFDEASAVALGQLLFTPDMLQQLSGVRSLRIYAEGPLASLPFSLLQIENDHSDKNWLIDRFSLSYMADFSMRVSQPDLNQQGDDALALAALAAPKPFLSEQAQGVKTSASPADIAKYFARDSIDATAFASLPPLPGAEAEVREIAAKGDWRSQHIFIGEQASEAAMLSEGTRQADIIVIAAHGIVAGEVEGIAEPALVLSPADDGSDGILTASEIAQLELSADWVILSSCDSAAGMGGGLPAFSGLAQSFQEAGAKDLLVSHWKVRDDVAAFVSSQTIINYRNGLSKADAINAAIKALRDDSGIEGAKNPSVWAPFILIEG